LVLTYTPLDDRGGMSFALWWLPFRCSTLWLCSSGVRSLGESWESGWGIGCDMVRMRGGCWPKIHNQHTILVTPVKRHELILRLS